MVMSCLHWFLWVQYLSATHSRFCFKGQKFSRLNSRFNIGGFLIGAFVGAVLSLQSGLRSEVKITTYYILTWSLLNGFRMAWNIVIDNEDGLVVSTIMCLIMGMGLAYVAIKQNRLTKNSVQLNNSSPKMVKKQSKMIISFQFVS